MFPLRSRATTAFLGMNQMNRTWRTGFSLTETAIVILTLGIIGAVAAPWIIDSGSTAEQKKTHQQLTVLRNAIEMYHGRSGVFPPSDGFTETIATMLNGPFPSPSVGSARGDQETYFDTDHDTNKPVQPDPTQRGGWAYKPANGSLKLNVESHEIGANW